MHARPRRPGYRIDVWAKHPIRPTWCAYATIPLQKWTQRSIEACQSTSGSPDRGMWRTSVEIFPSGQPLLWRYAGAQLIPSQALNFGRAYMLCRNAGKIFWSIQSIQHIFPLLVSHCSFFCHSLSSSGIVCRLRMVSPIHLASLLIGM